MKANWLLTRHDRRINLMGSLILMTLILVTGIFVYSIMQRQSARILDMSGIPRRRRPNSHWSVPARK